MGAQMCRSHSLSGARPGILYRVETAPTQHSTDGSWWWSGSEWVPARTPDGRWWFDGQTWRRTGGRGLTFGRFEKRLGVTWLAGFVLACVWAAFSAQHVTPNDGLTGAWLVSGVVLFSGWLLGMAATGYLLTRRSRSRGLLGFVPGVWLLMGLWVTLLATMPIPGTPDNDDGAAVGVVLMAMPAIAVLALLAGIGSALAWLVSRLTKRGAIT